MEPQRITAEQAKALMESGRPVAIVDARNPKAWSESEAKLPGAIRVPADQVGLRIHEIPHGRVVIAYCT